MTLDIRFHDAPPEQFQNVRMTTVYTSTEINAQPEVIIHFPDGSTLFLPLARIKTITTTND